MNRPFKKSQEAGEHSYWNHTGEEDKHFFKVMIGDFHERMTIPDGFVQHFSGATERTIKLESHSGYSFDVQVTWNLEKLVLESGWKEFASAHDLRMGDFLVFKYDGNSQLKVLVFGPSGCEKTLVCGPMKNAALGEERWTNPTGIISTCHDLPMKFAQSGSQTSAHRDSSMLGNNIIRDISSSEDDYKAHAVPSRILARGTLLVLNQVQKNQLEETIKAIHSEIPIYGCVVRQSTISGKTRTLEISREYAEAYLPFDDQMLTLQHHGKKWEVRCRVKDGKSKRLLRGWKQFAHDNNLQLGDACLFELLKNGKKYAMNVHIIRKSLRKW
ncbi:unnamed protein product [Alopecurus aequalis]